MDQFTVEGCVVFLKGTKDGTLLTIKKDLIKLQIEWETKLETNQIFVKEYFKEKSNLSTHIC